MSRLLFTAFFSFLIVACSISYDVRLAEVEGYLEENPDSAKKVLYSMSPNTFDRDADMALFILLNSMVDFDKFLHEPSDSLIDIASAFFAEHGDKSHLMQAYYLKGAKLFHDNQDRQAILLATRAHELAMETNSNIWSAKTSELIGNIYSSTYLHDEALHFRRNAAMFYGNAGLSDLHLSAMADVALTYDNMGQKARGLAMIDSVIGEASKMPVDSTLWYHLVRIGFLMAMQDSEYSMADSLYTPFKDYMRHHNYNYDRVMSARLEAAHKNFGKAMDILTAMDSLNLDNVTASLYYYTLADINASLGEFERAYKYREIESRYNSNAQNDIIGQPAVMSLRDFYNRTANAEHLRANQLKTYIIFGLILLVLAALWLRWHIRMAMRLKKAELETALSNISSLHADLSKQRQRNVEAVERVRRIYGQQWNALNMLSSRLQLLEDNDISRKLVIRQIENEMQKMATPENLQRLIYEADEIYDGLFSRLKQQVKDLRNTDLAILVMILAGMNTYTQCYITGLNRNTYYSRRRRLMIRLSQCPDESAKTILRLIDGSN